MIICKTFRIRVPDLWTDNEKETASCESLDMVVLGLKCKHDNMEKSING